jgi:hypothetical protein
VPPERLSFVPLACSFPVLIALLFSSYMLSVLEDITPFDAATYQVARSAPIPTSPWVSPKGLHDTEMVRCPHRTRASFSWITRTKLCSGWEPISRRPLMKKVEMTGALTRMSSSTSLLPRGCRHRGNSPTKKALPDLSCCRKMV